jgi:Zn-dependent protease
MNDPQQTIQLIILGLIPLVFAITVHEVAHGWVAKQLGDRTAEMMGRLTLNPFKHIDPIGTVALPILLIFMGSPAFGWAKPVPVTWENLKNTRRDIALVAVAGPSANLIMAVIWALIMKAGLMLEASGFSMGYPLFLMADFGITINIVLMLLNLLPILPLDGGRIMSCLLPGPVAYKFSRLEPYGLLVVMTALFLMYYLDAIWIVEYPIALLKTKIFHLMGL